MTAANATKKDVYQNITDRILAALDAGTVPWRCPWSRGSAAMPRNVVSDKTYRGINLFMLHFTRHAEGYGSPYWLTYKQAQERGGAYATAYENRFGRWPTHL